MSTHYFYQSLPPDQLKCISPVSSSTLPASAKSFRGERPSSVPLPMLNTLFSPLSVFFSFCKVDLSWHCTGTSVSWVLPFLYTLLEWSIYLFGPNNLICLSSPSVVYCLSGPSCVGVIPTWTFHTITELFAFWLRLTYSKVIHLKCRYKCLS